MSEPIRFEDVDAVDSGIRCEVVGVSGDGYGRVRSYPVAKGSFTEKMIQLGEACLKYYEAPTDYEIAEAGMDLASALETVRNHPDFRGG